MNKIIKTSAMVVFGVFVSANVNAALITCTDPTGESGTGGFNATSSIDTMGSGATVDSSNCGPHSGNTSNNLTAALGGYGSDLSIDGGADGGWVLLEKVENADGSIITGTGWGTTSGTFSFTDAGYSEYLIGLKFDGVYSTFLSNMAATNWGWDTDPDNDRHYAISNLTVYVKGESTKVPEPASIALMGLGLIGMGATARRRKKS